MKSCAISTESSIYQYSMTQPSATFHKKCANSLPTISKYFYNCLFDQLAIEIPIHFWYVSIYPRSKPDLNLNSIWPYGIWGDRNVLAHLNLLLILQFDMCFQNGCFFLIPPEFVLWIDGCFVSFWNRFVLRTCSRCGLYHYNPFDIHCCWKLGLTLYWYWNTDFLFETSFWRRSIFLVAIWHMKNQRVCNTNNSSHPIISSYSSMVHLCFADICIS